MIKSHPQDEATRELVRRFCDFIFRLKGIHYTCCELFEDNEARFLMEQTARLFFLDINKILVDYFLLEIAKLTDPARCRGGRSENFTVANLIESVEWPPDCLCEIKELNETILSFRKYIKGARDKILAHYDRTTVISGIALGGFPEGAEQKLLEALERMCDVLHKAAFGEIFGSMVPSHPGDVHDLKEVLRRAIAFNKLLSDSRGEERRRLLMLLDDVGSGRA